MNIVGVKCKQAMSAAYVSISNGLCDIQLYATALAWAAAPASGRGEAEGMLCGRMEARGLLLQYLSNAVHR